MRKLRILIIDDDAENNSLVIEALQGRYQVEAITDPTVGLARAQENTPDAILLDVDMPKMSGFEVCEALRASASTLHVPVVFLTSNSAASSMQEALHFGANDYLVKPFRLQELMNRLELRLKQAKTLVPIKVGNLSLDPATLHATVEVDGNSTLFKLTSRNYAVLEALMRNAGRVLEREQILSLGWKDEKVSDRSIDLHILRLRKLLKGWDHSIETVYGKGYSVVPSRKAGMS